MYWRLRFLSVLVRTNFVFDNVGFPSVLLGSQEFFRFLSVHFRFSKKAIRFPSVWPQVYMIQNSSSLEDCPWPMGKPWCLHSLALLIDMSRTLGVTRRKSSLPMPWSVPRRLGWMKILGLTNSSSATRWSIQTAPLQSSCRRLRQKLRWNLVGLSFQLAAWKVCPQRVWPFRNGHADTPALLIQEDWLEDNSENCKHESDASHDCYFFKWQDPYTVAPDRRVDVEDQLISDRFVAVQRTTVLGRGLNGSLQRTLMVRDQGLQFPPEVSVLLTLIHETWCIRMDVTPFCDLSRNRWGSRRGHRGARTSMQVKCFVVLREFNKELETVIVLLEVILAISYVGYVGALCCARLVGRLLSRWRPWEPKERVKLALRRLRLRLRGYEVIEVIESMCEMEGDIVRKAGFKLLTITLGEHKFSWNGGQSVSIWVLFGMEQWSGGQWKRPMILSFSRWSAAAESLEVSGSRLGNDSTLEEVSGWHDFLMRHRMVVHAPQIKPFFNRQFLAISWNLYSIILLFWTRGLTFYREHLC